MASETPSLVSPSTSLGPESSRDSLSIGWRSPAPDTDTDRKTFLPPTSSRLPPSPNPGNLTGLGIFRNYVSKSTVALVHESIELKDDEPLASLEKEKSMGSITSVNYDTSLRDSMKSRRFVQRMRYSRPSGDMIRHRIRAVGDAVEQIKGDIIDVTKSAKEAIKPNSGGLCEACGKIPFGNPGKKDATIHHGNVEQEVVATEVIASLDRVLQNRDWCKFCRVLFIALCVKENDPLQHLAVQNYIQNEIQGKTFSDWAEGANFLNRHTSSQTIWPFGHKSVIDEPSDQEESQLGLDLDDYWINDPELENSITLADLEDAASTASSRNPTRTEAAKEKVAKALNKTVETISSRVARIKRPVPVWITIKAYTNNHSEAGILAIQVQGQGRAPDASMVLLSSFNLRVVCSEYVEKESGDLRYGRVLDPRTIDLTLCSRWVEHCEIRHGPGCGQPIWSRSLEKPSGVGFRVVDVEDEKVVEYSNPGACDYVTLSYVWGGYTTVQLLKSNLSQLSGRGGLSEARAGLPQTVRSAMLVTRKLGKRYLWVDSLCIVQDSDDKVLQLGQMDRIYGNSAVTIVVADGRNADSGLDGVSWPRSIREELKQVVQEVVPGVRILIPIRYQPDLKPWETRAWTFQEKLLSKRLLVFSQGHAYFHCRHGIYMEDMSAKEAGTGPRQMSWLSLGEDEVVSLRTGIDKDAEDALHIRRSPVFDQYASLVGQYTSRHLSFSNDILNAIAGVMTILDGSRQRCTTRNPTYGTLYGLPLEFLDLALLWQPAAEKGARLRKRMLVDQDSRPLENKCQMPSWSWAAWEAVTEGERTYSSGVRYEDPFSLIADHLEEYKVKKVLEPIDNTEERVRPLLRWHKFVPSDTASGPDQPVAPAKPSSTWSLSQVLRRPITKPASPDSPSNELGSEVPGELKPVNGTGLGLASDSVELLEEWLETRKKPFHDTRLNVTDLPPGAIDGLDERHLIFWTSTAKFRLGNKTLRSETIFKYSATGSLLPEQQHWIHEIEILDSRSFTVGRVILHDATEMIQPFEYYDFIVVSEAQYFGNEERLYAEQEYPLYNVMMVTWDKSKPQFATRAALGKVFKEAWVAANAIDQLVILE
ncbi:heterokaryon incompatibility protein-domain-containing protein [Xylariales sp. AK1849]|nr:heterokaryon incompatibility protein-domain-containing protein [Xylariales sp. AK1849]